MKWKNLPRKHAMRKRSISHVEKTPEKLKCGKAIIEKSEEEDFYDMRGMLMP